MNLFALLRKKDIMQGVKEFEATSAAVLLDVRSPWEYQMGHIPQSRNLPLQQIAAAPQVLPQKDTPLYVYCQSGGRSHEAAKTLERMGYTNVTDIGGIADYQGKVERG